jgi:broad specificity phosphatase PhoE
MGVIHLVRHGQASFGAEDYDVLSALGEQQSRRLGEVHAGATWKPAVVVAGSLQRQQATAAAIVAGAGWGSSVVVDDGWNEFDHLAVALPQGNPEVVDSRAFQTMLEDGMRRWVAGEIDGVEPFGAFRTRTRAALDRLVNAGLGDALVVSSAGVIACLAATLIDGGVNQWIRLNRVCVNTGVTKVVSGSRGPSLVSFNNHEHLTRTAITYR